ncbi:MAG TPA: DinB family protein [Lacipirellulaceae bacterium]|nr:DinB family protein [Lacipirellulaceae bacterium]
MDLKDGVRTQFRVADFFVESYLSDITDQELMKRPAPGANHIAWQLGHLISAETRLAEAAKPGGMPALPEGFAERHSKDTAASDNPKDFLTKEQYLKLAKTVRAGTLEVLDSLSETDFDRPPAGNRVPPFVKTAGDCLVVTAGHWILHAGQWVVLRRELGRERKF